MNIGHAYFFGSLTMRRNYVFNLLCMAYPDPKYASFHLECYTTFSFFLGNEAIWIFISSHRNILLLNNFGKPI